MEEMEGANQLLHDELRKKEAEYEEKLLQVRQQQTSKLRWNVVVLVFFWFEVTDPFKAAVCPVTLSLPATSCCSIKQESASSTKQKRRLIILGRIVPFAEHHVIVQTKPEASLIFFVPARPVCNSTGRYWEVDIFHFLWSLKCGYQTQSYLTGGYLTSQRWQRSQRAAGEHVEPSAAGETDVSLRRDAKQLKQHTNNDFLQKCYKKVLFYLTIILLYYI